MATLISDIMFTGSLGNLSAYRMKGSDKIILRKKGGGSREKIRTSPGCEGIRNVNMEFGGRSQVTRLIRLAMHPVLPLADFNFTGHLHKILRPIQVMDPVSAPGQRNVHLTRSPGLLDGFSLNNIRTFDSVVRTPLTYSLDKENRSATVTIPALIPDINFFPHPFHPMYGFVVTLGIVPDLDYGDKQKRYRAHEQYYPFQPAVTESDWLHVKTRTDAFTLEVTTSNVPPDANHTLILSVGIRYGTLGDNGETQQVARTGSAKIFGAA